MISRRALAFAAVSAMFAAPAAAQEKPSVTSYLQQGYHIVHTNTGGQFIILVLQKDKVVVYCSVLLQTGDTTSCRTIK